MPEFKGFPKDFIDFFNDLGKNNNRSWFTANKQRYHESVVQPMGDYISAMAPRNVRRVVIKPIQDISKT